MQISHESIYRYVYLYAKKTVRLTLISQLRQEKKKEGTGLGTQTAQRATTEVKSRMQSASRSAPKRS